jgi:NAD(P)H-hydrate epimerase
MLEPLYTAAEMRAAEERYPGYPDSVPELMDRAGRAVAEEAMRRFPDARRFEAVCGKGSNGGDGRIAVEVLRAAGREADVVDEPGDADVVVDALFGTGFRGEPRPEAARLIERINEVPAPVVAVDSPSGADASTGEVVGSAVEAALTVTMHGWKVGLAVAPGRFHAGEVAVVDIGLEPADTEHRLVTDDILSLVPRKEAVDNKYTAGSVLVVGGSRGMTGAATLAARSAFRADAGYVSVAAPEESLPALEMLVVEAVKRPLEEVFQAAERARALAIGPGLGRSDDCKELVRRLLQETDVPAVVDADALWELEPFERSAPTVLTPHSGELGRLLGEESSWVDAHRLEALARAVERFRCVVVLKGADTLVGAPGAGVLVRETNTPALATAGSGDVLTGVIAAFLAKGMDARLAAAAGSVAQGRAALLASKPRGLVAGDIVESLPQALEQPSSTLKGV